MTNLSDSFDSLADDVLRDVDPRMNVHRGGPLSKKNFYHQKLYSEVELTDIPEDFKGIPFWCGDYSYHQTKEGQAGYPRSCCFNHLVGLPIKVNMKGKKVRHPIYDFQVQLQQWLEDNQHLWVKKARGIGLTTWLTRYLAWKCTTNDDLKGQNIFIITGTELGFANALKEKVEEIFRDNFPTLRFKSIFSELWINGVRFKIFPTKALKDMRGYTDVAYIFIDEADYFEIKQEEEIGAVIRSYQEKSNAKIIMVSTPYRPDGLFSQIEQGLKYKGFFKQVQLGYWVGLNKIYEPEMIEAIKKDNPDFEREYSLKYRGRVGNILTEEDIALMLSNGKQLLETNPYLKINPAKLHFVGLDQPGGGASPAVAVAIELDTMTQRVNIMRVKSWGRGSINSKIADELFNLYVDLGHNTRFYADGAKPEFINEVKTRFGERTDWIKPEEVTIFDNIIVPVNFNQHHFHMLRWMHQLINEGYVALPMPQGATNTHLDVTDFDKLLTSLRTCWAEEWKLDKKETVYDSHLDALRLALKGVQFPED